MKILDSETIVEKTKQNKKNKHFFYIPLLTFSIPLLLLGHNMKNTVYKRFYCCTTVAIFLSKSRPQACFFFKNFVLAQFENLIFFFFLTTLFTLMDKAGCAVHSTITAAFTKKHFLKRTDIKSETTGLVEAIFLHSESHRLLFHQNRPKGKNKSWHDFCRRTVFFSCQRGADICHRVFWYGNN